MAKSPKYTSQGAILSACGTYRYRLWREWRGTPDAKWRMWTDDSGKPVVDGAGHQLGEPYTCVFVMLNPSTADSGVDDPTIRRCVNFAKAWGYERMEVVNLFAYRATDPRALLRLNHDDDPVGPENLRHIRCLADDPTTHLIVCAWGAHGSHIGQADTVRGWMSDSGLYHLGLTKDGHPRHPLYVRSNQKLERLV